MKLAMTQMTDATSWKGLTTENHLGAIYAQEPQKASDMIALIQEKTFGKDLDSLLNSLPVKEFDDDRDYYWELHSQIIDNIPLIEARINGVPVTATDQAGLGYSEFQLVFPEDWFSEGEKIVGEKNEKYPIIIKKAEQEGTNTVYTCELLTGDPNLFIPFDEISGGQLFSREYAPVERTLSERGREVTFKSNISMRNAFSQIRAQKTTPGNLKNRKMGVRIITPDKKEFVLWQHYESFMFDYQFRVDINRLLHFGTSNRTVTGDYIQKGKSGYSIVEGSGLREQTEVSYSTVYNTFDIATLSNRLLDMSEGRLGFDERNFVAKTGERGAVQFHLALENHSQLFVPNRDMDRIYKTQSQFAAMGKGYGGQFVEYTGPNMIKFSLSIDSMYDDRNRNKTPHPNGGVAESYRYDVFDVGTTDGEPNIQKAAVRGQNFIIHKYIPGLRNPFDPDGAVTAIGTAKDGWEEHKYYCGGVMVKDPSKSIHFIPNIL